MVQSMGRVGSALDNVAAESFHSVLKVEDIHRHTFATRTEVRLKTATWIADFHNTKRRPSAADGRPHVEFGRIIQEARARPDQEGRAALNQRLYASRGLTPDLNPVEGVWAHVKRSVANLAVVALDRFEVLVRNRLKRLQRRPDTLDGFIAGTGLPLDAPASP